MWSNIANRSFRSLLVGIFDIKLLACHEVSTLKCPVIRKIKAVVIKMVVFRAFGILNRYNNMENDLRK